MAKKIKVGNALEGRFYILPGRASLYFCNENEDGEPIFQEVGSGNRVWLTEGKVQPVNIYMFSKED